MPERGASRRGLLAAACRSAKGATGLLLVLLVVAVALAAPALAPQDPSVQHVSWRFLPFLSPGHPLGGDNLGRDVFARVVFGARTSIAVALLVVGIATLIGSLLGAVAGYAGGAADALTMRAVDFMLAFPFLLLALIVMAVLGPGFWTLVFALVIASWARFARIVRAEALRVRRLDFIDAARAMGATFWRIVRRHVLPNVLPSMVVLGTLEVAQIIIAEAALSFLGLGVQPPTPSWGGMISDGRDFLADAPWMTLGPAAAIVLTSVGVNLFGDFLRDRWDPRL
ncbi:MAG TPA: ABC transporter permease [Acetobacteraceae bacterium]|jgi:ABC-type dipeptide/oligopeptide/nickel transport system permease subunit|nr:ABC transporter permease [Acetobacteraceae bacterium]